MSKPNKGIEKACGVMGGNKPLAVAVGVSDNFVSQWKTGARPVPLKYKDIIKKVSGISEHEIWPDVFGSKKRATA